MAIPKIDVKLTTHGAGFDPRSQVTDATERNLLQRIRDLFKSHRR